MTVVSLGEILIDRLVFADGTHQDLPGGAPANVATALAKLGVEVAFVGAVGQDAAGTMLADLLENAGVICDGLQGCDGPTRIVAVQCAEGGDRVFGGFVGATATEFADAHLSADALPVSLLEGAEALVTGTLGLAYGPTRLAMHRAADHVLATGGKLVVDVNWRPTFWPEPEQAADWIFPWLHRAAVIKISADEAIALFQTNAVEALSARFPQAQLFLTDGEKGCHYACLGGGVVPAFSVKPVEATGAGDAFLAGLIYYLARHRWQFLDGAEVRRAVTVANAMGALVTLKPGAIAAQPTRAELTTFLHRHMGDAWTIATLGEGSNRGTGN